MACAATPFASAASCGEARTTADHRGGGRAALLFHHLARDLRDLLLAARQHDAERVREGQSRALMGEFRHALEVEVDDEAGNELAELLARVGRGRRSLLLGRAIALAASSAAPPAPRMVRRSMPPLRSSMAGLLFCGCELCRSPSAVRSPHRRAKTPCEASTRPRSFSPFRGRRSG